MPMRGKLKKANTLKEKIPDVGKFRGAAIKLVMAPSFEFAVGSVIVGNTVVLVLEVDQTADDGNIAPWIEWCSWVVLGIFVAELILRLFALGRLFWTDASNVCDFIIVTVDTIFSAFSMFANDIFPVSILRIFRLAKLARISKLFRVFPEMQVLVMSLIGSARAICWGTVLLFFILLVWSMTAVLFLHPLAKDLDFGDCERCPRAYKSVADAMLTFWQQLVAGDAYGEGTILIIETYPGTLFFFIPMFSVVAMAALNLILGVVVDVSLSSKQQIDADEEQAELLHAIQKQADLIATLKHMDVDNQGDVTKEVVFKKFQEPGEFRDSVLNLDITEEDFAMVWTIVDADRKGKVPPTELIQRLYSIKTSDASFMLAYIKYYIAEIKHDLHVTMKKLETKVEEETNAVNDDIRKMEDSLGQAIEHIPTILQRSMSRQSMSRQTTPTLIADLIDANRDVDNEIWANSQMQPKMNQVEPGEQFVRKQTEPRTTHHSQTTELKNMRTGFQIDKVLQGMLPKMQVELQKMHNSQTELTQMLAGLKVQSALQGILPKTKLEL